MNYSTNARPACSGSRSSDSIDWRRVIRRGPAGIASAASARTCAGGRIGIRSAWKEWHNGIGMKVIAIDPGPTESAVVEYHCGSKSVIASGKYPNDKLIDMLLHHKTCGDEAWAAIEMIASYGMPVGREVFETCVWIGRYVQAWGSDVDLVYRKEVKMHLCGTTTAKDANIRQALIDMFGPGKENAIGLKKSRGPLYGISGDCWAALAVAVTWADRRAPVSSVKTA